jgi:DNA polymerase-1
MRDVELEEIKEYAVEDADVTLQLKEIFTLELDKRNQETFEEIEIPLVKVLADMEKEGIRVDVDFLKSMSKTLDEDIKILETSIFETAGENSTWLHQNS